MFALAPDPRHGPLPWLLLLLTVSTGLVDAATFLKVGHVFVANMTGNVVFLAFALGGATEFSIPASATALISFLIGASAGGLLHQRIGSHRGRHLSIACAIEVVLVSAAFAIARRTTTPGVPLVPGAMANLAMVALLGAALGLQNATIRRLGVPGLTTTVMTMTITGIAADWGRGAADGKLRPVGVVALFCGAAVGAVLVLGPGIAPALALMVILLAVTSIAAHCLSRGNPAWIISEAR